MGRILVERDLGGIAGLAAITPEAHGDARGFFMETWSRRDMAAAGLDFDFVQDNQSGSARGVLRGLHYQKRHPQAKLVRVVRGAVFDVAVDLRPGSVTYGRWHGETLSAENRRQFLIPRGFAHGFLVLTDTAEFCYKCDDFYHADDEGGIAWNDPEIGVVWPGVAGEYRGTASPEGYSVNGAPLLLSAKDRAWPALSRAGINESAP